MEAGGLLLEADQPACSSCSTVTSLALALQLVIVGALESVGAGNQCLCLPDAVEPLDVGWQTTPGW